MVTVACCRSACSLVFTAPSSSCRAFTPSARRRRSTSTGRGSGKAIGASDQSSVSAAACGLPEAGWPPAAAGGRYGVRSTRPTASSPSTAMGSARAAATRPLPLTSSTRRRRSSSATRSAVTSSLPLRPMDRTVPSGSGSCWPSQAASSRGPARSIWISPLAAGAAVFTVPSKLTVPPGTPRSISIGLGSPAATPSGRVTVPARVARLPSMVTPPSSLTGWSAPAWLIARSIASARRFSLPTRSSKLTTPPSTRMSPRTKPGIGVLAAGSFAAASPLSARSRSPSSADRPPRPPD